MRLRIAKLFSISIFLWSTVVFAQDEKPFKAGIKLGLNTSQMIGDGYSGYNKLNVLGGFFLQKELSNNDQLQFELMYIQKGSRDPGDPDNGNFQTYRIHMDYIEVPLLYQREWKKFLFEIGPGIGVLFNTKEENSFGVVPASGFKWRPFEIDAMVGVNYFISDKIFANVRIHQSLLSTVSTTIITPYGTFGGAFNSVIGASLNFVF